MKTTSGTSIQVPSHLLFLPTMRFLSSFTAALLSASLIAAASLQSPGLEKRADGRSVFAHVVVGILSKYTVQDWENEMTAAQAIGIDAFALNVANPATDDFTENQLNLAYQAAENKVSHSHSQEESSRVLLPCMILILSPFFDLSLKSGIQSFHQFRFWWVSRELTDVEHRPVTHPSYFTFFPFTSHFQLTGKQVILLEFLVSSTNSPASLHNSFTTELLSSLRSSEEMEETSIGKL